MPSLLLTLNNVAALHYRINDSTANGYAGRKYRELNYRTETMRNLTLTLDCLLIHLPTLINCKWLEDELSTNRIRITSTADVLSINNDPSRLIIPRRAHVARRLHQSLLPATKRLSLRRQWLHQREFRLDRSGGKY
jgi:hypothetical protein